MKKVMSGLVYVTLAIGIIVAGFGTPQSSKLSSVVSTFLSPSPAAAKTVKLKFATHLPSMHHGYRNLFALAEGSLLQQVQIFPAALHRNAMQNSIRNSSSRLTQFGCRKLEKRMFQGTNQLLSVFLETVLRWLDMGSYRMT